MKKTIRIKMTNDRCEQLTGRRGRADLALPEVEIDLDTLTPAARWIAEHITSTSIMDEARDRIDITGVAGFSMAERDRAAGKAEEDIKRLSEAFGEYYSSAPMKTSVSFPVYGKAFQRPEDVIEATAEELRQNGVVQLIAGNGDRFDLA